MPISAHRRFCWFALLLVAAFAPAVASVAQQTSPQPALSQSSGNPEYTIHTRVPITILDVIVTGADGRYVHGLMQSDFTILEDGKPVTPNSFTEHSSAEIKSAPLAQLSLSPNTFTNALPAPANPGPLNVILLDSLNTPLQVQQIVTQELLAFLKTMPPGTRVAVLNLTYRLSILQGFTTDRDLLKAAILSKKNFPQLSPVEDAGQDLSHAEDSACVEAEHMASRGQYTLVAIRQLARYLSGLPGRKNLIWFSGSFPLSAGCPGAASQTGIYDLTAEMHSAIDLLARAHVAIDAIDPRALDNQTPGTSSHQPIEDLTLGMMAEQTGGTLTYASNDLAGAVHSAIESGSNFYTLTYTPTNQSLDTRFRTITVKIDRPGLHLLYRPGYYATDPSTSMTGLKVPPVTPMQSALLRGSPGPTQILFKTSITQPQPPANLLPAGNRPTARQMKPPYRCYNIAYAIDIHSIAFTPGPDGNYRADFEFGVRVYNDSGDEIVNSAAKEVTPILPAAVYQSMLRNGATAHQQIAVPAKGDYFLRIAVHDLTTDRVGAIEVPTAAISPTATH